MSGIQEFDFSVDLLKAILWQYNDAANLQGILEQKQAWYDLNQQAFWEEWRVNVFDLTTANQFGCTVWSIILNIPIIVVTEPPPSDKIGWGFDDLHENFTHGNFAPASAGTLTLTVEEARQVLRMRYFQITTRGSVTEINQFMNYLFAADGPIWVEDNLDMTATYVFGFTPSPRLLFVIETYDILPRPAGVAVDYEIRPVEIGTWADGTTGTWGDGTIGTWSEA